MNLVFGGWRAIMAPKGLTPQQSAYWEGVLRKATEAPEWKADIERNFWSDDFVTGRAVQERPRQRLRGHEGGAGRYSLRSI